MRARAIPRHLRRHGRRPLDTLELVLDLAVELLFAAYLLLAFLTTSD